MWHSKKISPHKCQWINPTTTVPAFNHVTVIPHLASHVRWSMQNNVQGENLINEMLKLIKTGFHIVVLVTLIIAESVSSRLVFIQCWEFCFFVFSMFLFVLLCDWCSWAGAFSKWLSDDAVCEETGETMLMILNLAKPSHPKHTRGSLYSPDVSASQNNYIGMFGVKLLKYLCAGLLWFIFAWFWLNLYKRHIRYLAFCVY